MATVGTLFFVPVMYSLLRQKPPQTKIEAELREPGDPHHLDHEAHPTTTSTTTTSPNAANSQVSHAS
jgi:hypothetical protein